MGVDMSFMFRQAIAFNQDLSRWNVAQVTNMASMFYGASVFNADVSNWNVTQVTDMTFMFREAIAFNQDLSMWNVDQVTDMQWMFRGATSFRQVLCGEAWFNSKKNKWDIFKDSPGPFQRNGHVPHQSCLPSVV